MIAMAIANDADVLVADEPQLTSMSRPRRRFSNCSRPSANASGRRWCSSRTISAWLPAWPTEFWSCTRAEFGNRWRSRDLSGTQSSVHAGAIGLVAKPRSSEQPLERIAGQPPSPDPCALWLCVSSSVPDSATGGALARRRLPILEAGCERRPPRRVPLRAEGPALIDGTSREPPVSSPPSDVASAPARSNGTVLDVDAVVKHFFDGAAGSAGGHAVRFTPFAVSHFPLWKARRSVLVGESGCGKSTIARLVLGLTRPTAGRVSVCGSDIFSLEKRALRALRRRMQIVFQDPSSSFDPV
jgi:ABC-type glutathione transport system ATPase component